MSKAKLHSSRMQDPVTDVTTPGESLPRKKAKVKKLKPHTRVLGSWLSPYERPVLQWLAARQPAWVNPDILTGLGVLGSLVVFLGYALASQNKYFMILASIGFVINWYGDSLDGTLARFRKIERPKYGFFIDHSVDAFTEVCIFIGAGLSGFVRFEIAALALVGYMLLSVHVFITTYVTGEFRISYAKLGPTEGRIIAIAINTLVMFIGKPVMELLGYSLTVFDLFGILIIVITFGSFIKNTIKQGIKLSNIDRQNTP
jgi:archaetidylinositol phosphate synthase